MVAPATLTEPQLKLHRCQIYKKVSLISSGCLFPSLSCNLEEVQMVKQHLFILIPPHKRVSWFVFFVHLSTLFGLNCYTRYRAAWAGARQLFVAHTE